MIPTEAPQSFKGLVIVLVLDPLHLIWYVIRESENIDLFVVGIFDRSCERERCAGDDKWLRNRDLDLDGGGGHINASLRQ